jgi:hypothetical protein
MYWDFHLTGIRPMLANYGILNQSKDMNIRYIL